MKEKAFVICSSSLAVCQQSIWLDWSICPCTHNVS